MTTIRTALTVWLAEGMSEEWIAEVGTRDADHVLDFFGIDPHLDADEVLTWTRKGGPVHPSSSGSRLPCES